jgi:hypothetical protein
MEDIMFWQSLFQFLEKIALLIVPLLAAYLGWKLSQKTYIKQLLVDTIKQKFDALREIKSVIGNIPPNLSKQELIERLESDSDFRRDLTGRLVRMFGLRNELIPFIETEFIDLIDNRLEPLFIIENGTYTFREEKIEEFANFAADARSLVVSIENKLTTEYRNQLK